ncbi:MAG: hypothetical protein RMK84_01225 [Oscillochloridaceae bacterium]|nr:hypothetical protein [Chloroflexaceae bacterium]MDW8388720.1 hypothetical protein [Oscillochloridaceae bacterium]
MQKPTFDREQLYLRLPAQLQHLACSIEGWSVQRRRFGGDFPALLAEVEARSRWTPERIAAYRDRRLAAFVQTVAASSPFYRRLFADTGIDPASITGLDDLHRLPILTKDIVKAHYPELISSAFRPTDLVPVHTSGTTGGGLGFMTTRRALQEQWAIWWRYRRWHGITPETWCGSFAGRPVVPLAQRRPPFWRYNVPGRQILFSGYHMAPDTLDAYVAELRRRRPPWLHGYPSLLALLAAHMLDRSLEPGYQVRWVTIRSENLLPQQATLIERAFGVRPRQHYGLSEAVANISECPLGRLHVDEDFAAVEFLPNPNGPGCRIIGTGFANPAFPFLRYDTQDLVTVSEERCPCGRPGRIVAHIDGRQEDYIVLANGSRVGRMDPIFKDLVHIREAQIVQREPGVITVRVVRGAGYTQGDEQLLRQEIARRVGVDLVVHVEYVESLPRSGAGKLRFVISELDAGKLERVTL